MKTKELSSLQTRFEKSVQPEEGTSCLLWKGGTNSQGYGRFTFTLNGKTMEIPAHRFVWEEANNEVVPTGFALRHLCQNKRCVNLAHLELFDKKTGYAIAVDEELPSERDFDLNPTKEEWDALDTLVNKIEADQKAQLAENDNASVPSFNEPIIQGVVEVVEPEKEINSSTETEEWPLADTEVDKAKPATLKLGNVDLEGNLMVIVQKATATHCKYGHLKEYKAKNPDGSIRLTCIPCAQIATAKYKAELKAKKELKEAEEKQAELNREKA